MPDPRSNEGHDDFIDRCMGDPEARNDFPRVDQRRAFCESQWQRSREGSNMAEIRNVEILKTGTHKGLKFTRDDLDKIVDAFKALDFRPPVKLGHDDAPGAPAVGWVENVRRVGDKLVADFGDIPKRIHEMVRERMFDTVSSEVFVNLERSGKKFARALRAVALLGANIPAVPGLKPLREAQLAHEAGEELLQFDADFGTDAWLDYLDAHGEQTIRVPDKIIPDDSPHKGETRWKLSELPQGIIQVLFDHLGESGQSTNFYGLIDPASQRSNDMAKTFIEFARENDVTDEALLQALDIDSVDKLPDKLVFESEDEIKALAESLDVDTEKLKEYADVKPRKPTGRESKADLAGRVEDLEARLLRTNLEKEQYEQYADEAKELRTRIAQLEADRNHERIERKMESVSVPAFKPHIRALYELASQASKPVKMFDVESKDFTDVEGEALVDSLVDSINSRAEKLFQTFSKENSERRLFSQDSDVSSEVDEKVQKYMTEQKTEDYSAALQAVLADDPELAQRYAQE